MHAIESVVRLTHRRFAPAACLLLTSCALGDPASGVSEAHPALSTTTITVDADAYLDSINSNAENQSFGGGYDLIVDQYAMAVLRVDPEVIRTTLGIRNLVRARLRLRYGGGNLDSMQLSAHAMEQEWPNELAVTWNCPQDSNLTNYTPECVPGPWAVDAADPWQRPYAELPSDTVTLTAPVTGGDPVEFDVTADVLRILDGAPGHGWVVRRDSGNWSISFAARESAGYEPELVLETEADGDLFFPTECPPPDLDDTRITRVADVVEHIYSGSCPVQFGTSDSVIRAEQASHLLGEVIDGTGAALKGVHVRILGHSDFGWTRSREDGEWDLVVNGGGRMVVELSKPGYFTVQRSVEVPRNDYLVLDDVVLVPQQAENCLESPSAVGGLYVEETDSADARGARRLAMYFPSSASMTITDATSTTITDYCACAVEYTVDRTSTATGQRTMPGELPATSGYTYAAELQLRPYNTSSGKCDTTTIADPTFSSPIFAYVRDHDQSSGTDFLGFDVGTVVPSGYYDEVRAAWVAEPDGRVVEIVDDGSGKCALDVDGIIGADTDIDGNPAHDVTAAELAALNDGCGAGQAFDIGDRIWRIPVYHFTPTDWNWAVGFIGGALLPFLDWLGDNPTNDGCNAPGSIIGCEDQTLGEVIPIAGTPWALHYQSQRQRGRRTRYELDIPFQGRRLESSTTTCTGPGDCGAGEVCGADGLCALEPLEVQIEVQVAGHRFVYPSPGSPPIPYSTGSFHFDEWDGTDAWGRLLQGAQPVTVRVGYFYDAEYADPDTVAGRSFSMPTGGSTTLDVPAGRIGFWTRWRGLLGGWDQGSVDGHARGQGLGGWSVTPHHVYDARAGILYRGDGSELATAGLQPQISTFAGGGSGGEGDPASEAAVNYPLAAAVAPDGTVYVVQGGTGSGSPGDNRVRQIRPDGSLRAFAGSGTYGNAIDGVDVSVAQFRFGQSVARSGITVRRNGNVVVVDGRNNVVREIRDGHVYIIAGQQRYDPAETCPTDTASLGDGGPGSSALVRCPRDVVEGPDGAIYITEAGNDRIRRVDAAGRITTYATIAEPGGIAVSERGDVYVISNESAVWRIGSDGSSRRVAGGGALCFGSESDPPGDGGFAWMGCLVGARDLAIGADGSLYITERSTERVRRVAPNGIIETIAGRGEPICDPCGSGPAHRRGDGGAATSAFLYTPDALAVGHGGDLYIVDSGDNRVRRIRSALPDAVVGENLVAEPDGSLIYRFDDWGRHVATQHGLTGEDLLSFDYYLNTGLITQIAAVAGGPNLTFSRATTTTFLPLEIDSGFGQQSVPTYDGTGNMDTLTDPESRIHTMTYYRDAGAGLLRTFIPPDGQIWGFDYDLRGRLTEDQSPTITQGLRRSECEPGVTCDADVTSGWSVRHSFSRVRWSRKLDVWHVGRERLRRRVTQPTGARTIVELGDLAGALTAPTSTSTESVAITRLIEAADGSTVSVATGADPRPGFDEYARAVQLVRPSAVTTTATMLREVPSGSPEDLAHTIVVNGTRTTHVDVDVDTSAGACWIETTVTSPTSLVTTVCADQYGRVRSVSMPGFEPIDVDYDALTGDVSVVTQGVRETRVSYARPGGGTQPWPSEISARATPGGTALQWLTFTRDLDGWVDQVDYDSTTSVSASTLGFGRDDRGRITSLTLPHGEVHGHSYTALGVLSTYTPPTVTSSAPGGTLDVSAFDAAERPEDLRVMNGMTVIDSLDYVYHSTYGYLQRVDLPGSRSLVITRDATTTPDSVQADGRVTSLVLDGATTSYAYDGPFLDTETWTGTVAGSVDRDVDAYGELAQLTVGATALTYDHDDEGRLIQAGDLYATPSLETSPSVHWERGTTLSGSVVATTEALNRYGELDTITVEDTSSTLYSYSVTSRDVLGRETARSEQLTGEASRSYGFHYDGENRLDEVSLSGSAVATYAYDANGNRTSVTYAGAWNALPDVAHVYYDEQDRLTQYGQTSLGDPIQYTYTYTADGQLATRTSSAGTDFFEYDLLGNLLSVQLAGGTTTVDYDVDGLGRRIRRRVIVSGSVTEEQRWLYLDGLNPVAELDASNAITRIFVYGTRANIPDYMIEGSARYRFVADPRGSLRAVLDASGSVVQRTEYDAFGNEIGGTYPTTRVSFGFAGGLYDPLTNLVRFGARDYDPVTGRWTAKDPLLFDGTQLSLYAYVDGDPVNYIDPSGEVVDTVVDAVLIANDVYNIVAGCGATADNLISLAGNIIGALIPFATGVGAMAVAFRGGRQLGGMSLREAKGLMRLWSPGTFPNRAASIRYHAARHGNGNIARYLRRAANFNRRGAQRAVRSDSIRYVRSSGEYLVTSHSGEILTYVPPP